MSKFLSRKLLVALLSLAAAVYLARIGRLDVFAAGAIAAVLGLYSRANLQQKRDAIEAKAEGVEP